jgi:hypothetical protein
MVNLLPATSGLGFTAPWSSRMLSTSDRWLQGDHTSAPLTIDSGWREVADTVLAFVKRFT